MKSLTNSQKIVLLLISLILLSGCSDNLSYNQDAIRLTVSDIESTPTSIFKYEKENYLPTDTNAIKEIANYFDKSKHKIYLYADFSCACSNQQLDIAHLCKVFILCNIPDSSYEIYSMKSKTSKHPYSSFFTISDLPECIVMKDTSAVYFMLDTMRYYELFGQNIPVEQLLLNGLKK